MKLKDILKRNYTESTYEPQFMEDLMFSSIIRAIESEISWEYLPGAFAWADKNLDDAWTKATQRFSDAIDTKNLEHLRAEGQRYQTTVIGLIARYKAHKNMDNAQSFLDSLKPENRPHVH